MKTVLRCQKNRLRLTKHEYEIITALAFHSARLYNVGLYSVRQYYFANNTYLNYSQNYHACKDNENYRLLLSDTAQQILRLVERNMKSFFALWHLKQSGKYSDAVRLPHYKGKQELGIVLIQGRSARIKHGVVHVGFSKAFKEKYAPRMAELTFTLPKHIHVDRLHELRILPVFGGKEFDIEFVYELTCDPQPLDASRWLSVDMGLDNFATAFNCISGTSFIIDGKPIKHLNWKYNKDVARLQQINAWQHRTQPTRRIMRVTRKRAWAINDYFNRAVKTIADYCLQQNIGAVVVGDFSDIKRGINHGARNNQNFVQIPYGLFRQKLHSKCDALGIEYLTIEESYTSKTSFLDGEFPKKQETYAGRRIQRGLFRTASGAVVNADVNGAAQIARKYSTSNHRFAFGERVDAGFVSNPTRIRLR